MAIIDQTWIGKNVSFSVYDSAYLGNNFNNVFIMSILDAATATGIDNFDPVAKHIRVYPTIPPANAIPDDPYSYLYARIKRPNGVTEIIGLPWIDANTVVEEVTADLHFIVRGANPLIDRERIIELLNAGNFFDVEMIVNNP